jgi:hypothetical protein
MNSINQILQYVGGAVGKSKTQLINAIQEYFIKINREQKLGIIKYTTNATLLVPPIIY